MHSYSTDLEAMMATAVAPEVPGELKAFFADIVRWFWVFQEDAPMTFQFPDGVDPGSVKEAILRAHGVFSDDLVKQVQQLMQVFPEMKDHIWKDGVWIVENDNSREMAVAHRHTTPQAVNEFLVGGVVIKRLYELFKHQMEAILQEEHRRKASD